MENVSTVIIGTGEVGSALLEVLTPFYSIVTKDIDDTPLPSQCNIMHICLRYTPSFASIVDYYIKKCPPQVVNICTTVPPGTTRNLLGHLGVHSTTRGLHPNLASGLRSIPKHIGGPQAVQVAEYFRRAGIACIAHGRADTTEAAHIFNNIAYGVNLMLADALQQLCREYGVDYYEAVMKYTETNNIGYSNLDHASKQRMVLTPPGGRIGGHCVTHSAQLVDADKRPALIDMLAKYNDLKPPQTQPS